MRLTAFATLFAVLATTSRSSIALVWPDVPARIERGLSSSDPATRRSAARELVSANGGATTALVSKALGDSDVDVRLAAAHAAIRFKTKAATDTVIPWLAEREPKLRIAACEVSQALPSPRAVPALARALGDADAQVRAACADALGASESPDAVAPLAGKLDDPTPNVRVQVARALARLGDPRAVVPLVGKVQDSVPEVRQAVVRALGDLGDPRATQAVLLSLRDATQDVKVEALSALGRLRAEGAALEIAPLAVDRNPGVRRAALVALGRIGSPQAVRAMIDALGMHEDAGGALEHTPVRDALVSVGDAAVRELTKVLERPAPPGATASAAWILGELRATSSAAQIVAALRRGALAPPAALRALAGAGTSAELPVVLELLSDPDPTTREESRRAADALLDPRRPDGRAVEPLAAALANVRTSARERASIATLLGRTGAPRAAVELVGLVNANDKSLRLAAVGALGALGVPDSQPGSAGAAQAKTIDAALVPLLEDPDPAIRLQAAVSLGAVGGVDARRALLVKLDAGDEIERFAVFEALGGIQARHPDEATARRLFRELDVASGPERDAALVAAGRARLPTVVGSLSNAAKSSEADDRRAIASVLGAHEGSAAANVLARALTTDAEPSVRAEAAFALGSIGDPSSIATLTELTRQQDLGVATNAIGAIARIAARAGAGEGRAPGDPTPVPRAATGGSLDRREAPTTNAVVAAACPLLVDARASVRANALVALATVHRRCGGGQTERALLTRDPSDLVRRSAARAIRAAESAEDRTALGLCIAADRNADVARLCRPTKAAATTTAGVRRGVTIYIASESASATARPRAPFLVEYADGVLRSGVADRRGATFDPAAPEGPVVLRRAF